MTDGRVLMSWTEPQGNSFAVKVAISDGSGWSTPQTVVSRDDLFVNWADFPSAIALSDGILVAHWLQINGDASYQYVKWSCFLGQVCGLAKMHLVSVHAAFRISAWPKDAISGVRLSRAV